MRTLRTLKRPADIGNEGDIMPFAAPPGFGSIIRLKGPGRWPGSERWIVRYTDETGKRCQDAERYRTREAAEWARSFTFGWIVGDRMTQISQQDYRQELAREAKEKRQRKRRKKRKRSAAI